MDPLTLAVGVGTAAAAGLGTGLRLRHRLRRAEAMAAGLRRELEAEEYAANHDSLTGLPNRRAFYQLGQKLVADPARPAIACVVIDLNSFKQINDTFGHAAGDDILVTVARRLARFGGTGGDGNLIARLGGDEFAGLFTSPATDWALLYPAADDLADTLSVPASVAGRQLPVTVSVGAAAVPREETQHGQPSVFPDAAPEPDTSPFRVLVTALRHADNAMFRAKATGARAACFSPVLDDDAPARPGVYPPARPGPRHPARPGQAAAQPGQAAYPRQLAHAATGQRAW